MRSPTLRCLGLLIITAVFVAELARADTPPYLDSSEPLALRVSDLVSRLTLEEKANLMMNTSPGVPRLGIPKYDWWNEALHGVARAGEATVFPQAIALAATWDDHFVQTVADTISTEARAKFHEAVRQGVRERYFGLTFWTPNINIFRDPRWGRGQETYGEDPLLTSRIGVAFVRGLQGDDPHFLKTAACAKHFAVHSGPETSRHGFDVSPDESDFYETYLPAFEALVREAHVETVMTAYNSVYGQPCSMNARLYALLYQTWGFDGHVVSDCGSIHDLFASYKRGSDPAEAEALAVKAGLCLTCGSESPALVEAVKRNLITEREVDDRLGKLLRTMFRLGFFDTPENVKYTTIPASENNSAAHGELALEAARKSIVLLKNEGLLPLDLGRVHRIAVIGPNADSLPVLVGNYNGTPSKPVTVLAGLKAALGDKVAVDYVRGCDYVGPAPGAAIIPRTALKSGEYTGLEGDYFANRELKGKAIAHHRDRPIEFNWRQGNPVPDVPTEGFSVRWQGKLQGAAAGEYQLIVTANGGCRLAANDRLLIDDWTPGQKTKSATIQLRENEAIPLRLEYFQAEGPAEISLKWIVPAAEAGFDAAVERARNSDAVIFVGGINAQLEGEEMRIDYAGFRGGDRSRIELPLVQEKLIQALQSMGKPVVAVLMSGSALASPWCDAHLPAILEAWYPGQSGGTAVAEILLGRTNPSGRLPVTFYRATEDLPAFDDYRMSNRTYRYFTGRPLYPFGHGLSYSRFQYAGLSVKPGETEGLAVTATINLTNRGDRDGDEVVQVYAQEPDSVQARARESLCAFQRVPLRVGESKVVTLNISKTALRRWSSEKQGYVIPGGPWKILVGASSADIRQSETVTLPP